MISALKMHVLASGSKGNATLIEHTRTGKAVLIDCGICKRDFFDRSAEVGFDPNNLEAIVITHEHTDHTKGLGVVLRGLAKQEVHPRICVSRPVYKTSKELQALKDAATFEALEEDQVVSAAGLNVHPFKTSHDSCESFGFRIEAVDGAADRDVLGYLTDNGVSSDKTLAYLHDCRILALESNHDERMLKNGEYPFMVKQRIASDKGHLSNVQAAALLDRLLHNQLEHVVAMHISENNNTYRLPKETLAEVLCRADHAAVVSVGYQHRITTVS